MLRKTLILLIISALTFAPMAMAQPSISLTPDNIDEVVAAMSTREKAQLVVGNGWGSMFVAFHLSSPKNHRVPGAAGETRAIPRLGIPSIVLSDGPSGVRYSDYSTAFPSPILLASSADTALVYEVGRAMGQEALSKGVDVLLAPGMNLQRSPLCGRSYEYYSEDPVWSASMAAAMVRGIQSAGVGACVKHFAANNQETNRMQVDEHIDSAALRQLYLENFRLALREGQPWTLMSAYNAVNGTFCQEDSWLLTDVLRREWGYDGVVLTDWWFRHHPVNKLAAGNDLLTPGSDMQVGDICRAIRRGTLSEQRLNEACRRMLQLIVKTPSYRVKQAPLEDPQPVDVAALCRRAAARSFVLLKNDNRTLPLSINYSSSTKVALFGTASYCLIAVGTGSGHVMAPYAVSLADGLDSAGYQLMAEPLGYYTDYISHRSHRLNQGGFGVISRFVGQSAFREPQLSEEMLRQQASMADVAILTIGRQAGEAKDRSLRDDWMLTDAEQANIRAVCDAFHREGKRVVVILNICGPIEMCSWRDQPDAILLCWLPGQEGGNAMADVLSGVVAPQGKLPMAFPADYFEHPVSRHFPLQRQDKALVPDSITIDATHHTAHFGESLEVGQRFYDAHPSIAPAYPLGYGLTYEE